MTPATAVLPESTKKSLIYGIILVELASMLSSLSMNEILRESKNLNASSNFFSHLKTIDIHIMHSNIFINNILRALGINESELPTSEEYVQIIRCEEKNKQDLLVSTLLEKYTGVDTIQYDNLTVN